jgi:hypothetical protein
MDSVILADHNPEVVGDVFHVSALQVPHDSGARFLYTLLSFWKEGLERNCNVD